MGFSLQMGFEKIFLPTFSYHPIPRVRCLAEEARARVRLNIIVNISTADVALVSYSLCIKH